MSDIHDSVDSLLKHTVDTHNEEGIDADLVFAVDVAELQAAEGFRSTEYGKKYEEWLKMDILEHGPCTLSALGQGRFLPPGMKIRHWLSVVPFIEIVNSGADSYCRLKGSPVPLDEKPRKKKKAVEGQLTFSELFAVI